MFTHSPATMNGNNSGVNNSPKKRSCYTPIAQIDLNLRRSSSVGPNVSSSSLSQSSNSSQSLLLVPNTTAPTLPSGPSHDGVVDLKWTPLRKARNREFKIVHTADDQDLESGDTSPGIETVSQLSSSTSPGSFYSAQVFQSSPTSDQEPSPVIPVVKSTSSVLEKLSIFEKPKVPERTSLIQSLKQQQQSSSNVPSVKPKSPPGQQQQQLKDGHGIYWADVLKQQSSSSISRHGAPQVVNTSGQDLSNQETSDAKRNGVAQSHADSQERDRKCFDTVVTVATSTPVPMVTRTGASVHAHEEDSLERQSQQAVISCRHESSCSIKEVVDKDKIPLSPSRGTLGLPSLTRAEAPDQCQISDSKQQPEEKFLSTSQPFSSIQTEPIESASTVVSTTVPTGTNTLDIGPAAMDMKRRSNTLDEVLIEPKKTVGGECDRNVSSGMIKSEMELLEDVLGYINQKMVSLSPSSSDGDSDSGIKEKQRSEDSSDCRVRDMTLDSTTLDNSVVKRSSVNGSINSEKRWSKRSQSDQVDTKVQRQDTKEPCDITDEGIVVSNHGPSSGDSLEQVLDMTFFKPTPQKDPDGRKKKSSTSMIAGQQRRSPSTEPSGNYSLTTTTSEEEDGDGDDESSLEDRLSDVGSNGAIGHTFGGVTIRSPGLVSSIKRTNSGRKSSSSSNGLISFNDLSVMEMESFLNKYRNPLDKMKDEGKDTILYLPDFTKNAMNFLLKHGIRKEGIFRRSGVKSRINLLVRNDSSLANLDHACPYDVADFLKGWFRNQVPLLPASLVSTLLPLLKPSQQITSLSSSSPSPYSSDNGNKKEQFRVTNGTTGPIPDIGSLSSDDLNRLRAHLMVFPNRLAIESLFRFLYKISQYSDHSSMTISNLAIVWTPSLCREESSAMATIVSNTPMSPSKSKSKNKNKSSDSLENQLRPPASIMTPSASVSSNNFLLESVSNFMKDSRVLVEFLITNVDTLFCISRSDLMLPSPPVSLIVPTTSTTMVIGNRLSSTQPSSKTSTIDSRNGGSLRLSSFASSSASSSAPAKRQSSLTSSVDTYQQQSNNAVVNTTMSIPRGIRPPSIGCRRVKIVPNASPYDIFLRIILERRGWDPLVTEIIDEGSGVQKIKHTFSPFLRPSTPSDQRISTGQSRYTRCKSLTRSTNAPCHRRSVSTSSSSESSNRQRSSSACDADFDPDGADCPDVRYLTIKRKWPSKLDPSVQVIQIHEESIEDLSSRIRSSTGMPSYFCDWSIKSAPNGSTDGVQSSEISVAMFADLKGRPLCWYNETFPRLVDCYLDRISSFFNTDGQDGSAGGLIHADVADSSMAAYGFQSRNQGSSDHRRRAASFDPFCCISMKHVVQA